MPASITDKFKQVFLDGIWRSFNNLDADSDRDSDRYYIGIGRSEAWDDADETPPAAKPDRETYVGIPE